MVGTITDQGPPIDVFRSRVVTAQLGARFLTGLVGNMQYPRKTATSTLNWTTETGDALETGPTTDQVSLTPKRLTAYVDFSKQLLIQTAGGAEQMLLDDLRQAAAVMLDTVALRGTGASNQPRGIVNTSGIGAVIGGANGAQINWTHVTDLESAVANVDAAQSQCAYVVNTKTRGWLKKQPKVTNQMPIWPDVPIEEAGLERLNGYRCGVTNIMRSNLTKGTSSGVCSELIFGNFSDLLIGIWGDSLDVTIDPYTLAKSGQIRITVHLWADVAVRRQQSFAVMADALTV
jgi:HK97 family phage major capsid protein